MNKRYNSDDLEELLWRAEQVLAEPEEDIYYEDEPELEAEPAQNFDDAESEFFLNYANAYGSNVPNDAGSYDQPAPLYQERYPEPPQDFYPQQPQYDDYEEDYVESHENLDRRALRRENRTARPAKKRRKRGGCGCGCLTLLMLPVLVIALVIGAVTLFIQPPKSDEAIGTRKRDTATILLCGTDEDGTRTDTMMLMYLSGSEKQVRLLSLPRDTYTITSSGSAAKLNSAYGRNGTGEEGMDALMDYVKDIVGYRPDGYILVDFTLVPQIVDIMGGVDFDVPMDMDVASVAIEEGYQHLNGTQLMTLLRFRKGYATADLGRVEMQREVLKACMDQWLSPTHIADALDAISLLENNSISSLDAGNYLWMAKTILGSLKNFGSDTLPGYAEYRGDVSYYILNKSDVASLINGSYNPYQETISPEDLDIAS